jgi:dTDP-glucose 4,6-dehydratase
MKKILVTGAAGFVGKNLISLLVENGISRELIFVDKHPAPPTLVNELKSKGVNLEVAISNKLPTDSSVQDVDAVICLAGATSVDAALWQPQKAIDENIAIAVDLAEWSHCVNPAAKVIYMSSDEVLGASIEPLGEDAHLNPSQPYAVSKASAELILHNYRDIYDLNIVTLRSCNLVGFGQKMPKLIPTAVYSLLEHRPVPIHGDGCQLREWMDVKDLCRAIVLLLHQDVEPQVFQATSGVKISVNEVVKIIAESLGVDLYTEHVADRLVQDRSYAMQPKRLNSLGWHAISDPYDAIRNAVSNIHEEVVNKDPGTIF